MSLKKILTQKIKNPKTKEWIETSYVAIDNTTSNDPVIYMHGTLVNPEIVVSHTEPPSDNAKVWIQV